MNKDTNIKQHKMPNIILMYPERGHLYGIRILEAFIKNGIQIKCIIKTKRKEPPLKILLNIIKKEKLFFVMKRIMQYLRNEFVFLNIKRKLEFNNQVKTFVISDRNSETCERILKENSADILIIASTRQIKKNILSIPKIGTINAHNGLLPEYRGTNCILWAIYNQDKLGVTTHFVDEDLDSGDILLRREIVVEEKDSLKSIREKIFNLRIKMLRDTVKGLISQKIKPMKQDSSKTRIYRSTDMPKDFANKIEKNLSSYIKKKLEDYKRPDYKILNYEEF